MGNGFGKKNKEPRAKPAKDRRFAVALVKHERDKQPRQFQWRLKKLTARMTRCTVRAAKSGPGITLGSFDGALEAKFCTSSSGYLGDVDNTQKIDGKKVCVKDPLSYADVQATLDTLGCSYMLHTTHSNEPDWPHLRFVIPFAEDIAGDSDHIAAEYKRVHAHLNAVFNGRLDHRSSPAFMAFLPATPKAKLFKANAVIDRPLYVPGATHSGDGKMIPVHIELPDRSKELPEVPRLRESRQGSSNS